MNLSYAKPKLKRLKKKRIKLAEEVCDALDLMHDTCSPIYQTIY